ncbi:hypothetical protein VSH64_14065 [Amycolatopsis rhabdoformis]|uniref:Uncharacterized protein n=1 Tax=Amycolatopsis rhabdoformis TaxID=1448059 RepID=A0ABZ1IFI7_9PSEU|nr:hypothetical protein [Amycolatopsis rhabdoformis]WSE33225.1 hypothetical protein VSH64_14065 [Amycolatopsis rhabdoformis]
MIGNDGWPLRSAVESTWRQVIARERTRESAHTWAAPWVEGSAGVNPPTDTMIATGLGYLHGLTMKAAPDSPHLISHFGRDAYLLSAAEVTARFDHWLALCHDYDADPAAFRQRARRLR